MKKHSKNIPETALKKRSEFLKNTCLQHGFYACGIAAAQALTEHGSNLKSWLRQDFHADMKYMQNHTAKRIDPRLLFPGTKSVISLMYNYYPEKSLPENAPYKISRYAYGKDYHKLIKKKLWRIIELLKHKYGDLRARAFVDSAPILERAWAAQSGIGWIGKNTQLISLKNGSYFFLAEILTDLEFAYDQPIHTNYCGDCSRCMDACPTQAIKENKVVDSNNCISYLTIEHKSDISAAFKGKYDQWIFGCDICQEVCPWNKFSITHREQKFFPPEDLFNMKAEDWEEMKEDQYKRIFEGSAVKRSRFAGLKKNIRFVRDSCKK